jgi:uracil phosphoribosyltransferase
MLPNVTAISHPLLQHKLTIVRDAQTTTDNFRRLVREIASMMAYEVTRDLPTTPVRVRTPVAECMSPMISGKKLCLVSILRAGTGMLDGMIDLLPGARVGHIGLYRDPESLQAVEYYFKVPEDIEERLVIVVDPMLATGNSAIAAVSRLKEEGVTSIKFVCLLAEIVHPLKEINQQINAGKGGQGQAENPGEGGQDVAIEQVHDGLPGLMRPMARRMPAWMRSSRGSCFSCADR